jgi:hypothetical protein
MLSVDPGLLAWLLTPTDPAVRHFTLAKLLGRPPGDPDLEEARAGIVKIGPAAKILAAQKPEGYWGRAEDFYVRAKYRGTVWQIITLAELGADARDSRVKAAAEFVLTHSQDRLSGGFAFRGLGAGEGGDPIDGKETAAASPGGDPRCVTSCLTGNMVFSLIRFGYLDDPRVWRGIEWITRYQRFDDGDGARPRGWPYDRSDNCWGRHTCHMGVVKTLKALAEIPVGGRTASVGGIIERAAEHLLRHHIFRRSHDLSKVSRPEWLRFGFPLMWNTDALECLGLLIRLGYGRDPRLTEARDLVLSKRGADGRWALETTFNGRTRVRIEQQGAPSKWVTGHALWALREG